MGLGRFWPARHGWSDLWLECLGSVGLEQLECLGAGLGAFLGLGTFLGLQYLEPLEWLEQLGLRRSILGCWRLCLPAYLG